MRYAVADAAAGGVRRRANSSTEMTAIHTSQTSIVKNRTEKMAAIPADPKPAGPTRKHSVAEDRGRNREDQRGQCCAAAGDEDLVGGVVGTVDDAAVDLVAVRVVAHRLDAGGNPRDLDPRRCEGGR